MKKAIAVSLFIAILLTAFTCVAFAMTEDEVLKAAEESEGKFEMGSPLSKDDFIVFTESENFAKYDNDILTLFLTENSMWWNFWGCTSNNSELRSTLDGYSISFTYRGIGIENKNMGDYLCSKGDVLARYGIGVAGSFDSKTDVVYKYKKSRASEKKTAELLSESCSWLLYNYKDVAQIKFFFDSNDVICYCVYFNGIRETADKETTQTIQEYLNENGYDCGTPDGIAGKKTKAALTQFQEDHDLFPSGYIDDCLMKYLDKQNVNI